MAVQVAVDGLALQVPDGQAVRGVTAGHVAGAGGEGEAGEAGEGGGWRGRGRGEGGEGEGEEGGAGCVLEVKVAVVAARDDDGVVVVELHAGHGATVGMGGDEGGGRRSERTAVACSGQRPETDVIARGSQLQGRHSGGGRGVRSAISETRRNGCVVAPSLAGLV